MRILKRDTLSQTFEGMPDYLLEIVMNLQLPNDEGRRMAKAINGEGLIGTSDGSIKAQQEGIYVYSI